MPRVKSTRTPRVGSSVGFAILRTLWMEGLNFTVGFTAGVLSSIEYTIGGTVGTQWILITRTAGVNTAVQLTVGGTSFV